jgi:hypothetical protein
LGGKATGTFTTVNNSLKGKLINNCKNVGANAQLVAGFGRM